MANWLSSLLRQIAMLLWHAGWHLLVFGLWLFPWFWDGKHYFWLARHAWAPGMFRIGSTKPTFVGQGKVDWTKPHVIVANHQGNADVPLLMALVPTPVRFLAKRSVGHIPILGWMMHLAGFPFVDRDNARKGRQSIDAVAARIRREAQNVVVFPEGTRTPEGTMLPFKQGAFILAIKAQVPIVPIAIEGSGAVFPRASFRIFPGPLKVTVGDPISTEGKTTLDRKALVVEAEGQLLRMLGWRRIDESALERERAADRERRLAELERPERDRVNQP